MDMAKLAAALAINIGEVSGSFGIPQLPIDFLPLTIAPTTSGTGSKASALFMPWIEMPFNLSESGERLRAAELKCVKLVRYLPRT